MAKKQPDFNPEDIEIIKIGIFKSNFDVDYNLPELVKEFKCFKFCVSQKTAVNVKEQGIRIRLNVKINALNKKDQPITITGDFGIEFHYHVKNFKQYTEANVKKKLEFKPPLGGTILGITYSTVRGIIFTKTANSVLPSVILPVIEPKKLFTGEYEFVK